MLVGLSPNSAVISWYCAISQELRKRRSLTFRSNIGLDLDKLTCDQLDAFTTTKFNRLAGNFKYSLFLLHYICRRALNELKNTANDLTSCAARFHFLTISHSSAARSSVLYVSIIVNVFVFRVCRLFAGLLRWIVVSVRSSVRYGWLRDLWLRPAVWGENYNYYIQLWYISRQYLQNSVSRLSCVPTCMAFRKYVPIGHLLMFLTLNAEAYAANTSWMNLETAVFFKLFSRRLAYSALCSI